MASYPGSMGKFTFPTHRRDTVDTGVSRWCAALFDGAGYSESEQWYGVRAIVKHSECDRMGG